jgi:hypothetical protein
LSEKDRGAWDRWSAIPAGRGEAARKHADAVTGARPQHRDEAPDCRDRHSLAYPRAVRLAARPGYGYDLAHHIMLNPLYGLGGHERSRFGYLLMAARRGELGDDVPWLADMQRDRTEPLYMDAVHDTAPFCDDIAAAIAERIVHDCSESGSVAASDTKPPRTAE